MCKYSKKSRSNKATKFEDTEVGFEVGDFDGWDVTGAMEGMYVGFEDGCLVGSCDGI